MTSRLSTGKSITFLQCSRIDPVSSGIDPVRSGIDPVSSWFEPIPDAVGVTEFFRKFAEIFAAQGVTGGKWQKIFKQKNFNYFVWTPLSSRVNISINFCLQVSFKDVCSLILILLFAAGVVDTGGNWPPASLTPLANLPLVSLTPVANFSPVSLTLAKMVEKFAKVGSGSASKRVKSRIWMIRIRSTGCTALVLILVFVFRGMRRMTGESPGSQTMQGPTSSSGRGWWNRCRWYRWCALTYEYLREFSKKFETVLMEYSGAGGKLIHQKTRSKKSLDTVPLNSL